MHGLPCQADDQRRQREFKVGGTKRRNVWGVARGMVCRHWGEVWGRANFFFCDFEMAYFGEFSGAKFKVFLYRELHRWGSGRFCGKFWISEQNNE